MSAHIALLRGINLGKRTPPMKRLAELFEEAGAREARTYIQSGNVVFAASDAVTARIASVVTRAIAKEYGHDVPIVIRSAAELRAIVRANPYLKSGADPVTLHVGFLAEKPARASVAALDPDRSPGDAFTVRGSEVYFHMPNGMARTKLTSQYFDSRLRTVMTVRNWRTVGKLLEMAESAGT